MEEIGVAKTTTGGFLLLLAFAAGMYASAASLFGSHMLLVKALAALPALLGSAVLWAMWRNQQYS